MILNIGSTAITIVEFAAYLITTIITGNNQTVGDNLADISGESAKQRELMKKGRQMKDKRKN